MPDHHAELQQPVERGGGLGPVRELEGDDLAGSDSARRQQAGQARALIGQVADRSLVGPHRGEHARPRRAVRSQAAGGDDGKGVVGPESLGLPAAAQLDRCGARFEVHGV